MRFEPKVSIVIPVYNGSNFLQEAINSAINQTYKNIEIIVVNDGSNDSGATERISKSFGDKITYLQKINGGTSTALNLGIKNMTGEYFCWLSHDDLYKPEFVESLIQELNGLENKQTIVITELDGIDENGKELWENSYFQAHRNDWPDREKSKIYPVIYKRIHGCQAIFHKSIFEDVGLFDESQLVAQDFEFFSRAFRKYPNVLIPRVLGTARDSANRQGKRLKPLVNTEYSHLFFNIAISLSDDEIAQLAPTKLRFFQDMKEIWAYGEYTDALDSLDEFMPTNLQVNSSDLVGQRFNGYDLHVELKKAGIDSKQIVWEKLSNENSVSGLSGIGQNPLFLKFLNVFEDEFDRKSQFSPLMDDILNHVYFLDSKIVHLHLLNHPAFNLNDLPLISSLKPTIWTLHDPWMITGHCIHQNGCLNWQTHCNDCPFPKAIYSISHDNTAVEFQRKKLLIRNSNIHIHVGSEWMARKIRKSPIFLGKKISVIPFGVDTGFFCPGDSKHLRQKFHVGEDDSVLFARVDREFKGTSFLNDVLKHLPLDREFTLITVGEPGLISSLPGNIRHIDLGWVSSNSELRDLYRLCDVFLMPSERESFGMMAIEAMACGKVVLALDVPESALSETINSPQCGLAVEPSSYADALLNLLSSNEALRERGDLSLTFARENYGSDVYTGKMVHLYRQVIKEYEPDDSSILVVSQLRKNLASYRRGKAKVIQDLQVMYLHPTALSLLQRYLKTYGVRITFRKVLNKTREHYNKDGFKKFCGLIVYRVKMEVRRSLRSK